MDLKLEDAIAKSASQKEKYFLKAVQKNRGNVQDRAGFKKEASKLLLENNIADLRLFTKQKKRASFYFF